MATECGRSGRLLSRLAISLRLWPANGSTSGRSPPRAAPFPSWPADARSGPPPLFRVDVALPAAVRPFLFAGRGEGGGLLGAGAARLDADLRQRRLHLGMLQDLVDLAVELRQHRRRQSGRRIDADQRSTSKPGRVSATVGTSG